MTFEGRSVTFGEFFLAAPWYLEAYLVIGAFAFILTWFALTFGLNDEFFLTLLFGLTLSIVGGLIVALLWPIALVIGIIYVALDEFW